MFMYEPTAPWPPPSALLPEEGGAPPTLVHVLAARAALDPHRPLYAYAEGEDVTLTLSVGEVHDQASALARRLLEVARPGDRALLLYPPGLDFIVAYYACLLAGVVAVPAYPPRARSGARLPPALMAILASAEPALVLGVEELTDVVAQLLPEGGPTWLATDALSLKDDGDPPALPAPEADALAMLQYTSGSTGEPRGVMLTHRALVANLETIRRAFGTWPGSVGVFWLPFYHDMGLIGGVLETLYCGGRATFMAPMAFLMRPGDWLTLISRLKANISGAPNFAYEECVARLDDDERRALDLSRWRLAFCGAELVHPSTLTAFAEAFAPAGFEAASLYPCYGLAEATLMVAGRSGIHVAAGSDRLSCGPAAPGMAVALVDAEAGAPALPGEVGEVWVQGPSVGEGYWRQPEASRLTFGAHLPGREGRWLRTGDLGRLLPGEGGAFELAIVGRLKDLIIVGGVNHHPEDVEAVVRGCHPSLAGHRCAAFAVEVGTEERLVVVAEAARGSSPREVAAAVRRAVGSSFDLPVHEVRVVLPRSLPTTSSGKVRRRACRDAWLAGELRALPERAGSAPPHGGAGAPSPLTSR